MKLSSVPKVESLNFSVEDHYQTALNKRNMTGKELFEYNTGETLTLH